MLGLSGAVMAQAYPSKPVRIVLPFPAGSSTDTFMRVLADRLRERLGQTVLIDPRPGAGAVIATQHLMTQAPDGYTVMATTSSQTITSAKPNPPFDIRKDLTHIVQTTGGPTVIAVNVEKMPNVRTMKDLVDHARANPGVINFGSYGAGSLGHLGVELFNQVMNVKTVHIPYKGSPANVLALAGGDSHVAIDVMTFLGPQIQAGKVRAIAQTTQDRSAMIPELPGMRDAGYPDFTVQFWQGFGGPAGLPRDIVGKLNATVNAALKDQAMVDYTKKTQTLLFGGTSEAITDLVNREVTMWAKLIRDAKIDID
jgi:tripartite-type tricarboxylate transporter receptor subunit TctC